MDIDEKTKDFFEKTIRLIVFFTAIYGLLFLSGEHLAFHTGGYTYELSSTEEEFIVDNKMAGEMTVYPVNDETMNNIIRLFLKKETLDGELIYTSLYMTLLLIGLLGIFIPAYRIIKNLKIYMPILGIAILAVVILQYNYYLPEIEEINQLIYSLNHKVEY